jgi:two-component system sensor histidine kinase ArlS
VIDSGIGIPSEDLPFVFDRFYRVDKARSRERGGTGLGLAIAKRLVERNHGEISISSVEHHGTSVKISFPIAFES